MRGRWLAGWVDWGSLRAKFALRFALTTVAIFAVLLPSVLYIQRQAILSAVEAGGFRLATVFAHSSVVALKDASYLELQYVVNLISRETNVQYAMLLGEDGKVLAHSQADLRGERYRDAVSVRAAGATQPLLQHGRMTDGTTLYDFAVPVYVAERKRATARIGLSIDPELAQIARTRNSILLLGIAVLGIGLVWAVRQARHVTDPIQTLVRGTQEIARGNLSHRIPTEGNDEIGQLAHAFNRMTESVQALIETSRELSSALETDRVLHSIAKYAVELVGADVAAIAPLGKGAREAVVRVVLGARTDRLRDYSLTVGRDIQGRFLSTGEPFVSLNCLEDPTIGQDVARAEIIREEGIASLMTVPIMLRGDLVGILWVASRTARIFSQEDVDVLQRMAAQAAIALENARLYEDLRQSHDELMAAQEELVRKTRLAAMGEIAAAVAHETRNPLGALINCVELLQGNPNITGEDAEVLAILKSESQRLNEITSDFLTFGRPRQPDLKPMDLNLLVAHILDLLRRDERCPVSITVEADLDPALPAVQADEDQLRQVFWNLFLNAVQAMKEGGTLSVRTAVTDGSVAIEVQDTGYGIPQDILPKIFEPFFTTRARGTGLGLAIVRRIVEEHGGRVAVSSRQGEGTTIRVTLPLRGQEV